MPGTPRHPKLPPGADVVFRRLFDDKDGCRLLISLLNALLKLPTRDRIRDLSLLRTQVPGPGASDKEVVLDIRARTRSGRQFNIEVQVRDFAFYPERALYYFCGMYHGQIGTGKQYQQLQPAYAIHILFFRLLPDEERFAPCHHVFELRERRTGHLLTEHLQIHTLEMVKFKLKLPELQDDEAKWLYFLQNGHELTPEQARGLGVPEIAEAERRLEMISQDRLLQVEYELRRKAEMDATAYVADKVSLARKEALKEGLQRAIFDLCEVLGVTLTPERRAHLEALDAEELEDLRRGLKQTRDWPL